MTATSQAPAPLPHERDALFKTFGRAWFRRDVALLYEAVTADFAWTTHTGKGGVRRLTGRDTVAAEFAAMGSSTVQRRFEAVAYHHAPEATFMTFRLIETDGTNGGVQEMDGVERYTFKDGRIAQKDVYLKPVP